MDCSFVKNHLFDYQEMKLSVRERVAYEEHLLTCNACNDLYSKFESAINRIEELKSVDVDPFLATRLIQRIENELQKEDVRSFSFLTTRLKPVFAVLVIFLAVTFGILLGKYESSKNSLSDDHRNEIRIIQADLQIPDFIDENNILISSH